MSNPSPRTISTPRVLHTLGTLVFASVVCVALWGIRALIAGNLNFSGFVGNLLLAWIPLGLALAFEFRLSHGPKWLLWTLAVLWLLFFPNAFYIVTDLIHFKKFGTDGVPKWLDIMMITGFATGGMFLGCLSLYVMHLLVRARWGWKQGWGFGAAILGLGAIGIYLGRFARLNSWDVFTRPWRLWEKTAGAVASTGFSQILGFIGAFFLFSLAVYAFVVSIARLHEGER